MADTLVETNVIANLDDVGLFGPYWIDTQTAIIIFLSGGDDLSFSRTTDGGVNWSTTEIQSGTTKQVSAWFDQETPNDNGILVHLAWIDQDDSEAKYVTVDVSDATISTIRTVASGLTVNNSKLFNKVGITKTISGNILYTYSTNEETDSLKSIDNFSTAGTSIANLFQSPTDQDHILIFPSNTGDDNDAATILWDRSANQIKLRMYDDSADTWTNTFIVNAIDFQRQKMMDASVRHSDRHIILAAHSNHDDSTDDLLTFDLTVDSIASPTITAKTNIFTNQAESGEVAVLINQQNDDIYISYLKGVTWNVSVNVVFHKSDNGMSTWGAQQPYSEVTDDYRLVHGGRTVGNSGGRVQWSFFDDDQIDIYVNLVNDIEIPEFVPPTGVTRKIKIAGTFQDKPIKTKVAGVFVDKPIKVKVGGNFQDA